MSRPIWIKNNPQLGWIIGAIITVICALIGAICYGILNGLAVFIGSGAMAFSLFALKKSVNLALGKPNPSQSASTSVILASLFKLPMTLGLLALSVWMAHRHFGPLLTAIVLVYFAIVIGVFCQTSADRVHN